MATSTGHLIAISMALILLHEFLPMMSADLTSPTKESDNKRPALGSRRSALQLDPSLFAYPHDFVETEARFSTDDERYKQYYDCYCNDTMQQFEVTLPCDKMMNNSIGDKEEANLVILHHAGIEDSIFNRMSLYEASINCVLKVYYDDVYNCYCESIEEYYNTTKLPCDKLKENTKNEREDLNDWILQDSGIVFYWYTRLRLNELWVSCVLSSLKKKQEMLGRMHSNDAVELTSPARK
ncbi:hypothetical protein WDU94_008845 [Cyamophila willieti]